MEGTEVVFKRPSEEALAAWKETALTPQELPVPGPWGWIVAHPELGFMLTASPAAGENFIRLERAELETLRKAVNHLLDCPDPTLASVRQALGE